MSRHLFLIFHGRFPSEKAAGLFAARSADAFAKQGWQVTLLVPRRRGVTEDPQLFYGMSKSVEIVYLPILDLFTLPVPRSLAFWASFVTFAHSVRSYVRTHAKMDDVLYSNESLPLWQLAREYPHTVYEMHDFPEGNLGSYRRFIRSMEKVIIHNHWKTEETIRRFGVDRTHILTEPNAVDTDAFNPSVSRAEARKLLDLPADARIVGYTGHLYGWKGAHTLAEAALTLPELLFIFVGGTEQEVAAYRARFAAPNIRFEGFRSPDEIPLWQRAADVLVLPNTGKEAISAYYTSPMKLFEYMASGTPIVASRIPSVEELVDETMVHFATADDTASFAAAVTDVLAHPDRAAQRAAAASQAVSTHTWDARAKRILDFITRSSS